MTTPDVPLRLELEFELPGTPAQVWHAIATAEGISAWFIPTDVDEREGGAVAFHMGDTDSKGTVTGWEPPTRFAYVEPDWAGLGGHAGAPVSPLATEFVVEARSGGTCVVRVVSSAFGTGADWEQEFFDEMEQGWTPFFAHLRLYLTHFPGQEVTAMEVGADVPGDAADVCTTMRRALGLGDDDGAVDGEVFAARGFTGVVERSSDRQLLVRLTSPLPGYVAFYTYPKDETTAFAQVTAYLFSDEAAAFVERERPGWQAWIDQLAVAAR